MKFKKAVNNTADNLVKLSSLDNIIFSYFQADFTLLCTGFQIKVNQPLDVQVIVLSSVLLPFLGIPEFLRAKPLKFDLLHHKMVFFWLFRVNYLIMSLYCVREYIMSYKMDHSLFCSR